MSLAYLLAVGLANRLEVSWRAMFSSGIRPERVDLVASRAVGSRTRPLFTIAVLVVLALLGAGCAGEERESSADADGELIVAARAGDVERVRSLLERDAAVDARDASGATALVAYGHHLDVARSLIEAGADVNVKDERQQSAYLIATSEVGDDPRLLELTLANGADVDAKDSYNGTGLIRAADRGHVRIVERLLERSRSTTSTASAGRRSSRRSSSAAVTRGTPRSCACSWRQGPT